MIPRSTTSDRLPVRAGHMPGSRARFGRRRGRRGDHRVTGRSLLANLRARGLRVQHVGSALHVAPRAALTDADREALRQHRTELIALLQAESDPGVIAAIDVFPGVQVVSTGHPAVWPPRGGGGGSRPRHTRSICTQRRHRRCRARVAGRSCGAAPAPAGAVAAAIPIRGQRKSIAMANCPELSPQAVSPMIRTAGR
jgi:hypothetical protein